MRRRATRLFAVALTVLALGGCGRAAPRDDLGSFEAEVDELESELAEIDALLHED